MGAFFTQSLLIALVLFVILLLGGMLHVAVLVSIAASVFIAFAMPHTQAARPRYLVGGYIIGILCGVMLHYGNMWLVMCGVTVAGQGPHVLCGPLAAGLAVWMMTVLNYEHPPAAALALGLVLEARALPSAGMALGAIVFICGLQAILRKRLHNLL